MTIASFHDRLLLYFLCKFIVKYVHAYLGDVVVYMIVWYFIIVAVAIVVQPHFSISNKYVNEFNLHRDSGSVRESLHTYFDVVIYTLATVYN